MGENLIAGVLGPQADFSRFSPRPPGDTVTRSPNTVPEKGSPHLGAFTAIEADLETGVNTGVDTGVNTGVRTGMSSLYQRISQARPASVPPAPPAPPPRPAPAPPSAAAAAERQAGLDIHEASTLILDEDRAAHRFAQDHGVGGAGVPQRDADDALHSAPTLILDHRRRRRPSGG